MLFCYCDLTEQKLTYIQYIQYIINIHILNYVQVMYVLKLHSVHARLTSVVLCSGGFPSDPL